MSDCNLKEVFCLNNKSGSNRLLVNISKTMKNLKTKNDLYSFSIRKRGVIEEHRFAIDLKKSNKKKKDLSIKIFDETQSNFDTCMNIKFFNHDTTKGIKGEVTFKRSRVKLISAGKCSLNEKEEYTKKMSGTYILRLIDKLNIMLNVSTSELYDDSRLILCDGKNASLKIAFLIKSGKTWYEKEVGYKLEDTKLYDYSSDVQKLTVKELIEFVTNEQFRGIGEMQLNQEKVGDIKKLLAKIKLDMNANLKQVTTEMFKKDSKLTDCEKFKLWKNIFRAPIRKEVNNEKIKSFYNLMGNELSFNRSVKEYF